jgi:cytochrome c553
MGRSVLMLAALALYGSTAWSADYVAMSGKDLYQRFCASCHGAEGHGDGPERQRRSRSKFLT